LEGDLHLYERASTFEPTLKLKLEGDKLTVREPSPRLTAGPRLAAMAQRL
jgi:hypothetical protein